MWAMLQRLMHRGRIHYGWTNRVETQEACLGGLDISPTGLKKDKRWIPKSGSLTGSQFSSYGKLSTAGLAWTLRPFKTHICVPCPTSCWSVWLPGLWDVSLPDWGPSNLEVWDAGRGRRFQRPGIYANLRLIHAILKSNCPPIKKKITHTHTHTHTHKISPKPLKLNKDGQQVQL